MHSFNPFPPPLQICGLAYPLYIALRRHAAVKHDSEFDLVRYGPAELLEAEPVECPQCEWIAFTDPAVLKLHLSAVHNVRKREHSVRGGELMGGAAVAMCVRVCGGALAKTPFLNSS